MRFFLFFLLGGLAGCGASGPQLGASGQGVVLQVHLPAVLSRAEVRRAGFLGRVSRLQLQWETKSGKQGEAQYPPQQWDQIQIPEFGFPVSDTDVLNIRVKVWDLGRDGSPRSFPALSGRTVLKAVEMAKQGATHVHLRLSIHVPVSEYDGK